MNENNNFDFESFKRETIKGMYADKPLNGEKGIFAPLLKYFLKQLLIENLNPICRKKSRRFNHFK